MIVFMNILFLNTGITKFVFDVQRISYITAVCEYNYGLKIALTATLMGNASSKS